MESIYTTYRKPMKCAPPILESVNHSPTLCTLSTGNIAAFTSLTELEDTDGDTWGSHVYVCDINAPWNSYKVSTFVHQVSALEWDIEGKYLLVANCVGDVHIYSSKDYLLNEWICLYTASFPGEHIIKAAFFHNGRKIVMNTEKKTDQIPCTEKFQFQRFSPSVRQFGGVGAEGALVVTSSGLLGALLVPSEPPLPGAPHPLAVTSESLGSTRGYIATADICYGKNGHFLIAASSGVASHAVRCYRASVRRATSGALFAAGAGAAPPPSVTSQPLPSFFLQEEAQGGRVVCVAWCTKEDTDTLLVGAEGARGGALLETWGLVERAVPVHSLLVKNGAGAGGTTPGGTGPKPTSDCFNTVVWQHQHQYRWASARVVWASASRWHWGSGALCPALPYVAVATHDNTLHLLYRDTLKPVCSISLKPPGADAGTIVPAGGATPPKQMKYGSPQTHSPSQAGNNWDSVPVVCCCDTSYLGGVLLAVDAASHLHLYKLPQPATETASPMAVIHATTLLEYSLVTGYDALDILMTLKSTAIEPVYERLSDSFVRQPAVWQQYHYGKWLCLRAALSRLNPTGQSRASDLTSLFMLHSISSAFKSLLRPSELTSHDKGPADNLAAVVSEPGNPPLDMDKALMHLEAKEFAAEPLALQSLRRLVQHVADAALALLASVPARHAHARLHRTPNTAPNYELWRDTGALNMIRELLVIARVWGLLRAQCLPTFSRAVDCDDVMATLYKLLTKLAAHSEPDEATIVKCSELPSQVLIPRVWESLPRCCVATPAPHKLPLTLEFGTEPEILKYVPEVPPLEGSIISDGCVDSIRHIHLGLSPGQVKRCPRCGSLASPSVPPRTAAVRAWDQRWIAACRCGGRWTLEVHTIKSSPIKD